MLHIAYNQLTTGDRMVLADVAKNPPFRKLLKAYKEVYQTQLMNISLAISPEQLHAHYKALTSAVQAIQELDTLMDRIQEAVRTTGSGLLRSATDESVEINLDEEGN